MFRGLHEHTIDAKGRTAVPARFRDVLARGLDWHLLGPWHEVVYGLESDQPSYVESGLAGAVQRLQQVR